MQGSNFKRGGCGRFLCEICINQLNGALVIPDTAPSRSEIEPQVRDVGVSLDQALKDRQRILRPPLT